MIVLFLNEVCHWMIHLSQKKLKNYRGNYDTMLKTEEYTMVGQIKDHDNLEKKE